MKLNGSMSVVLIIKGGCGGGGVFDWYRGEHHVQDMRGWGGVSAMMGEDGILK